MQASDRQLEQRLIAWIADYLGVAPGKVSVSTRVNLDLGVDGGDAVDLMQAFGKHFHVDVSKFPYDAYFGPEASNPFGFFRSALRFLTGRGASALEPLYVSDLLRMANKEATS